MGMHVARTPGGRHRILTIVVGGTEIEKCLIKFRFNVRVDVPQILRKVVIIARGANHLVFV